MNRPKIQIITVACRRGCGKQVSTVNRSITGADAAHAKYSGVCKDCIKPDELKEIERAQLEALRGKCSQAVNQ